jgi:ribose transport system substrate-binding protein
LKKTIIWIMAVIAVIAMSFLGIGCKATTAETTATATTAAAETTVAATTAAAETTAAVTTAAEPKTIKIGYAVTYGTHPSVMIIIKGAVDECMSQKWADKFKVEVIMADAGWDDPTKIVGCIEDLSAQKVNGLLVFGAGAADIAPTPIMDLFVKNNIPVALTDQVVNIPPEAYVSFATSAYEAGGAQAAEYVAKLLPKGSKVQAWNGTPGSPNAIIRCKGYEDKMKELGMTVLPQKGTSVSLEQGQKDMEDLLVSDPDIKAVFSTTNLMLLGALNALKSADKVGQVLLTPYDIDSVTYQAIVDGGITACVLSNLPEIGRIPAEALMKTLAGEKVDTKDVEIPTQLVTKENYKDFANDPQVLIVPSS